MDLCVNCGQSDELLRFSGYIHHLVEKWKSKGAKSTNTVENIARSASGFNAGKFKGNRYLQHIAND